jgi:hypothetical protein
VRQLLQVVQGAVDLTEGVVEDDVDVAEVVLGRVDRGDLDAVLVLGEHRGDARDDEFVVVDDREADHAARRLCMLATVRPGHA